MSKLRLWIRNHFKKTTIGDRYLQYAIQDAKKLKRTYKEHEILTLSFHLLYDIPDVAYNGFIAYLDNKRREKSKEEKSK